MTTPHSEHEQQEAAAGNGMNLLLPLLLMAFVAAAVWYFMGTGSKKDEHHEGHETTTSVVSEEINPATIETTATGTVDTLTGNFVYNTGKMITLGLPNNAGKLEVGEFSTENKLFNFLNDKTALLDTVKGNWFEFTEVRFKTGGAVVDSSSLTQIKNIAAVCKAFPAAQFKIGGYTDNSGDSAKNVALSQKRADAVLNEFKKQGVAAAVFTGAKGYGPEHPVAANASAEGRAMNRRVAVNVKAK